ncbi:hypothetical protein MPH_13903 [Macrophomina phaseolina MS6]|uniref:Uncharacterized protein n=1 Tax=Macrophomina phaseolina (strain MS6) TaxID=1126212 RepID=K2RXI3_MACPH|nr:hypothetical protein MPH_13903 [Macrophomina phaseolina MS6]
MMDVVSAQLRFSPPEELGTFLVEEAEGERRNGDDVEDSDGDEDNNDADEERVPATWKQTCTAVAVSTCNPAIYVDQERTTPDDLLVKPCCEPQLADVYSMQASQHCGESLNGVLVYTVEVFADEAEGKDDDEEDGDEDEYKEDGHRTMKIAHVPS